MAGPANNSVTVTAGDFAERLNFTSVSTPTVGKVNFTIFDSYGVYSSSTSSTKTYTGHFTVTVDFTLTTEPIDVLIYIDFGSTPPNEINYISVVVDGS